MGIGFSARRHPECAHRLSSPNPRARVSPPSNHTRQVRCDKDLPSCGRCARLKVACIPRLKSGALVGVKGEGGAAAGGGITDGAAGGGKGPAATKRAASPAPPPALVRAGVWGVADWMG